MAKKQEGGRGEYNLTFPHKGLNLDTAPNNQKEGTYRFALNTVIESREEDIGFLSLANEEGNTAFSTFVNASLIIGSINLGADEIFYVTLPSGPRESGGTLHMFTVDKAGVTTNYYKGSNTLNFSSANKLDIVFRLRRGCERVLYITDGLNPPYAINIDRIEDHLQLSGGRYVFSPAKCKLLKSTGNIISFEDISIENNGSLLPGSYNIGVSLLDSDKNSTEVINVSDTINIYHDSLFNNFEDICGSTTEETSFFNFKETTKSIKVILGNLDSSYKYYRLYLIQATSSKGRVSKVSFTDVIPIEQTSFELTGNNTPYETTEEEIKAVKLFITSAQHIEHLENRLILGNVKGPDRPICDYQILASKISSEAVFKTVVLNDIQEENNQKRPTLHNEAVGYMPGEIYAFGISYVFPDGYETPVYHIPGKNPTDTVSNMSSDNACANLTYVEDSCNGIPFWGKDSEGDSLDGVSVRHHRFPLRSDVSKPLVSETVQELGKGSYLHTAKLIITGRMNPDYDNEYIYVKFFYKNLREDSNRVEKNLTVRNPNYMPDGGRSFVSDVRIEYVISELVDDNPDNHISLYASNGGYKATFQNPSFTAEAKTAPFQGYTNNNTKTWLYSQESAGSFTGDLHAGLPNGITDIPALYRGLLAVGKTVTCSPYFTDATITKILTHVFHIFIEDASKDLVVVLTDGTNTEEFTVPPYFPRDKERMCEDLEAQIIASTLTFDFLSPGLFSLAIGHQTTENEIGVLGGSNYITTVGSYKALLDVAHGVAAVDNTTISINLLESINSNKKLYTSDIFGIKFSNVTLPKGAVGYNIYRMERDSANKTIIDSAVLSQLINKKQYNAFTQFYPDVSPSEVDTQRFAFLSPEHKFLNHEFSSPTEVLQEGVYLRTQKRLSSVKQEDAFPGTSYDPALAKKREKDEDGFTLHCGYRYNEMSFEQSGISTITEDIKKLYYLDALTSVIDTEGSESFNVYNVSEDNKIAILKIPSTDSVNFSSGLPYVVFKRNIEDPYSNYKTGTYYKENTNLLTEDAQEIYNGDSYISPLTVTTTTYYDTRLRFRASKSGILRGILGVVIVVFAAASVILTGGATTAFAILATSAGLSLTASGIRQSNMKKTYEEEFNKGLRDVIKDGDTDTLFAANPEDDEIQYFSDILENVFFESSVNMNLRTNPNYGQETFIKTPSYYFPDRIKNYCLNKVSVIDTNQENGRIYQGYSTGESYFFNRDYLRRNRQKLNFAIDNQTYSCCSDCPEKFPHRIHWSEQSFQEELTDNFRNFLPNNYADIPGETGDITNLFTIQTHLFIHTERGLWNIVPSLQERVTGDIITFLGTGTFLSIPPRKVVDSLQNSAGCIHKWATIKTPYGVTFVDYYGRKIYLFNGEKLTPISEEGIGNWCDKNIPIRLIEDSIKNTGNYPTSLDITQEKFGIGYIGVYDSKNERLIFTKKDFIIPEGVIANNDYKLTWGEFLRNSIRYFQDYSANIAAQEALGWVFIGETNGALLFKRYDTTTNEIEYQSLINTPLNPDVISVVPEEGILNNSWTLSYSFKTNSWISFHSYLPCNYIPLLNSFLSFNGRDLQADANTIYKHDSIGFYQNFYGQLKPHIIEYVAMSEPLQTKIWDYIQYIGNAKQYDAVTEEFFEQRYITFNKAIFYNEEQTSGELTITVKDKESEDFFENQIINPTQDTVIANKTENNWFINELRDYRIDYQAPIFIKEKSALQDDYFIDKIVNEATISYHKDWTDLQSFRSKYLIIRLIFDTFDNIKMMFNFSIENEKQSFR